MEIRKISLILNSLTVVPEGFRSPAREAAKFECSSPYQ